MRKKEKKLVFWIVLIILGIFFINQTGIFEGGIKPLSSVTFDNYFYCKETASSCNVRGVVECNQATQGEDKVIFRTDGDVTSEISGSVSMASKYRNKWVVIDFDGTGLQRFSYYKNVRQYGSFSEGCLRNMKKVYKPDGNPLSLPDGADVYLYESTFSGTKLYFTKGCREYIYFIPDPSNEQIDISQIPKENCDATKGEICSGELKSFLCTATITPVINKIQRSGASFTYSGSTAGTKKSDWITLQPGDSATISGDGKLSMEYDEFYLSECEVSSCNTEKTGYYTCENRIRNTTITLCDIKKGYACEDTRVGAKCVPPFDIADLSLSKSGFLVGESIIADVQISSSIIPSGELFIKVMQGEKEISSASYANFKFDGSIVSVQITNPGEVGAYYVIMEVGEGANTLRIGNENGYNFNIGSPLTMSIPDPRTETAGYSTYVGYPARVGFKVLNEIGEPLPIDTQNLQILVKIAGVAQALIPLPPTNNLYEFEFIPSNTGSYEIKITAYRNNIPIKGDYTGLARAEKPQIITTVTNKIEFASISPQTTPSTIKFELKTSLGNLIDIPTSQIKFLVKKGVTGATDEDISNTLVSKGEGKYEAQYIFAEAGAYTLKILPTYPGHDILTPEIGGIDVRPGNEPDECNQVTSCPYGKVCINGKCEDREDWLLICIVVGVVIILLITAFMVFYKITKKKGDVYLGGGW